MSNSEIKIPCDPDRILLTVGISENRNGRPMIILQFLDLMIDSKRSGRYLNHGSERSIKRLLKSEKILRIPSLTRF